MPSEPPTKKIKLELSDPDKPLTRQDVIAFQKEALFRSINQYRTNLEALKTQYDLSRKQCNNISKKLANLMALVVTLARFLESFCETGEEKQICKDVSQGDETVIVQLSDAFMRILTKYSGQTPVDNEDSLNLTTELKGLQKSKDELFYQNKQLTEEISVIKDFYQKEIRKYDREDSLTLKRVFKKEPEEECTSDSKENTNTNPTAAVEPKTEKLEDTQSLIPEQEHQLENDKNEIILREIEMSTLQNQIESLKSTIDDLEKFKSSNEQEMINLRTAISNQSKHQINSKQDEGLLEKVQYLTRENQTLSQTNNEFLSKFQELNRDREIYTGKLTKEFEAAQDALKKHNSSLEKDLVRIRAARDDLLGKLAILESERGKSAMATDLQNALDILREQWEKLEQRSNNTEFPAQDVLTRELQELEKGFKELSTLLHKKYSEYLSTESVISKLTVEKTKADQKYFAAMRSKDSILIENKNLSKSLGKSNELILQLKDADRLYQQKIESLNRQLELSQNNEKRLIDSNKTETLKIINLNSELSKLKKSALKSNEETSKNIALLTNLQGQLQTVDSEKKTLKSKANTLEDQCSKLQKLLLSNGGDNSGLTEELENFRTLVYCSLCSKNWKSTAIKTCGHVFCDNCCKERLNSRMRKCPSCNKAFSSNDLLSVHL